MISAVVGRTIDLYGEPTGETYKVEHNLAERMLAAKLMSARPLAEFTPDKDLREIARPAFALR